MKKLLTLTLTVLMALTAVFGLTACKKDGSNSGIINPRDKYITVGYTDYAPMNYNENGKLVGFDTELAIMTFEALGYNVRFKLIQWKNKYLELENGTIDCIWNGFTSNGYDDTTDDGQDNATPRKELVAFTYDYMQNAQCIVRKDQPEISSASNFEGKFVSYEIGSSGESLAKSFKTGDEKDTSDDVDLKLSGCSTQMDAITKVSQGLSDYAIVDILLAQSVAEQYGLTINSSLEIGVEYYAVAFSNDNTSLRDKVNIMFETFAKLGYLNTLANKYKLGSAVLTDFSNQQK